ncbi:serine protease [Stenotrophomonas sp. GD03654]|nr:serine protease [Stenotrophomonas sp. GD03654]MBN5154086.1 trypsin-like peptidase domain-containing protein [Stenotrophomonas maltophilia]MDH2180393.1 serine protease [Stenotrophomonas sp. GD03654]HEL4249172.1 trypsin-like peptidase domain-containing protein [Stenotrophomonas maltophilia]
MNPATLISLSTVRLLCGNAGVSASVGTGFFYGAEFNVPEGVATFPMVVTNKHVVANCNEIKMTLTVRQPSTDISEMVVAPGDIHQVFLIPGCQERMLLHPDPNVDLCAFFIGDIMEDIHSAGYQLRNTFLNARFLVPDDEIKNVRPIEPVMMVGYPNGLWDEKNNRPLARRGSTASHPFLKWNGKPEFVIDAACFPGSSGSPVFLFEDLMYRTKDNAYTPGTRAQLLGILASGPLYTSEGKLIQRNIPTSTTIVPVVQSMMNLGNVVHASAISDIVSIGKEASLAGKGFPKAIQL